MKTLIFVLGASALSIGALCLCAFAAFIAALITVMLVGGAHTLLCVITGWERDNYPEELPKFIFIVSWVAYMILSVVWMLTVFKPI